MPTARPYDERLYNRAVRRLKGAIKALWDSGATWQTIEDEIEEAQRDAGISPRAAEERETRKRRT
jgi:hypothetical protein